MVFIFVMNLRRCQMYRSWCTLSRNSLGLSIKFSSGMTETQTSSISTAWLHHVHSPTPIFPEKDKCQLKTSFFTMSPIQRVYKNLILIPKTMKPYLYGVRYFAEPRFRGAPRRIYFYTHIGTVPSQRFFKCLPGLGALPP